jgi:sn-glycerol 3-phosphate transport system ATP-binding protein
MEAMTLGDQLMVMNGGIVEQIGSPLTVYAQPESVFVAGFIGSPAMNLLDAQISDDGQAALVGSDRLPLATAMPNQAQRPVTLGLRPEHLTPATADDGALHLEVDLVEALGADTVVHGRLAGSGSPLAIRLGGTAALRTGDRLAVQVPAEQLHLFDADSGRRWPT